MSTYGSANVPTSEVGAIPGRVNSLSSSAEALRAGLNRLEKKLEGVLLLETPSKQASPDGPRPVSSPLGEQLNRIYEELEASHRHLDSLIQRLEV